jgi:hypothetical protein
VATYLLRAEPKLDRPPRFGELLDQNAFQDLKPFGRA